jgi:putative membrane protein
MSTTKIAEQETAVIRPNRSLRQYAGITLRGMAMGAADIIPGVSGGTMAFILGIYEELIDSIRMIGQPIFLRAVFGFRVQQVFQLLNWKFLLALGSGIFIAILTMSGVLGWLLVNQPVFVWSFFFGLVLSSAFIVSRRITKWTPALIATMLGGTLFAYVLVGLVPANTPNTWWFLFLSGMLASCAMILPGISGAFILVILGKYTYVLNAVNNRDIVTLGFVAAGAVVGLVSFAQVLSWMFKRHHDLTVAVLIGLMFGSLRKIWPWKLDIAWLTDEFGQRIVDSHGDFIVTQQANILPNLSNSAGVFEFAGAIALMVIGIVAIIVIERMAGLKEGVAEA